MSKSEYRLRYRYSLFWLIFWTVLFFPVALVLALTGLYYCTNHTATFFRYGGSRGWLAFWTLVFFPVAILLLVFNGISVVTLDGPEARRLCEVEHHSRVF